MINLTTASHELFMALANDADNWSGMPPTDGNVGMTREERGNLTQLKRQGLITTEIIDGDAWVIFTAAGTKYAAQYGVTL